MGFTRARLEFLFKAEYAYDIGMPQWVAQIDHLFGRLHLERIWLGRHKIFHFRVWYRDQLAKYVREILLDPRSLARPYVEPKAVRAVVDAHIKGNRTTQPRYTDSSRWSSRTVCSWIRINQVLPVHPH